MTGRKLRKYRGKLTQIEFANLLGVVPSQIPAWEQGKKRIPAYIEKLVECLHATGAIKGGNRMKTFAYLIENKETLIGYTHTAAENGEAVSYGEWLPEQGVFHQLGRAKISRAKRHETEWRRRMEAGTIPEYDVNYGGGEPV